MSRAICGLVGALKKIIFTNSSFSNQPRRLFVLLYSIRKTPHLQAARIATPIAAILVVTRERQQILLRMPGDRKRGRIDRDIGHLLARLRVANVNDQILAGRRQQPAIVTERNRAHRPVQAREHPQAGQLIGVPQRDQRIRRAGGEIPAGRIELDANARARMRLEHVAQLQLRIAENVHATEPIGEEELIAGIVPRDLVHLEVELLLGADALRPRIDERHQILLVAHRDRVAVRRPRDVDVLALRIDDGRTFAGANVPDAHRFVAARRAQEIRLGGVPAQLVHGAGVAAEGRLFGQAIAFEREYRDAFVERTGGEPTAVAVPADRVDLGREHVRLMHAENTNGIRVYLGSVRFLLLALVVCLEVLLQVGRSHCGCHRGIGFCGRVSSVLGLGGVFAFIVRNRACDSKDALFCFLRSLPASRCCWLLLRMEESANRR